MNKRENDELGILLMGSSQVTATLDEIVRLLRHRVLLLALALPIPLIVRSGRRLQGLPHWLDAACYCAGVISFVATMCFLAVGFRRLYPRPTVLHVPFILLTVPAVTVAIASAELLNIFSGAPPHPIAALILCGIIAIVGLEVCALSVAQRFVPTYLAAQRQREQPPAPTTVPMGSLLARRPALPQSLNIGGKDIPFTEISHIVGEGNVVIIYFGNLSLRVTARFATVLVALPREAGMQINVMVWVSACHAARARLVRSGGKTFLELPNGNKLGVASGLRSEVAAWLQSLRTA